MCLHEEACDSEWSQWNKWSKCSKTCGPGNRSRYRECIKEGFGPAHGLQGPDVVSPYECPGDYIEFEACPDQKPCPAYYWTQWHEWTACAQTCTPSTHVPKRARHRMCLKKGEHIIQDADLCPGGDSDDYKGYIEYEDCPLPACPAFADWSPWTKCDQTCTGSSSGTRSKTRLCKTYWGRVVAEGHCGYGWGTLEQKCNTQSCSGLKMIYWENQMSHGSWMSIASNLLSGVGDLFQQCADFCYTYSGMG